MGKIVCKICNSEYNGFQSFSNHIRSHNITNYEYSLKYDYNNEIPKCQCGCGENAKWLSVGKGFQPYLQFHKRAKVIVIKQCVYCDVEFESNIIEDRKYCSPECCYNHGFIKSHKTLLEKYGTTNVMDVPEIKDKVIQSNLNRSEDEKHKSKEKLKQTILNRYGVDSIFKSSDVKEKIKKTIKTKYGVDHQSRSPEIRDKIKQTTFDRYGVDNITKDKKVIKKRTQKNSLLFYTKLFTTDRLKGLVEPLFTFSEFKDVQSKYKFKCLKCNNIFESNLDDGKIPRCYECFPIVYNSGKTSIVETEIRQFINDLNLDTEIIFNDRRILNKKELDIYLPEYKLAIEVNGVYWHSEVSGGKDKHYHLNKTELCEANGIQLIHITDYDWNNKQDVVKSIIKNKLKLNSSSIYARKCVINSISNEEYKIFLNNNHLSGYVRSKIKLGLFYNNELISVMSFNKSRFNKKYEYELIRFANKLNTNVVGGFNKLVSYFINHFDPISIISYVDRNYFNGNSYKVIFNYVGVSSPNYKYHLKNTFYNRVAFQKHKLKSKLAIYDENLTEWENMQLNGYDRIWDCGTFKFELFLK